jgi:hypothetical protein
MRSKTSVKKVEITEKKIAAKTVIYFLEDSNSFTQQF